MPTLSFRDVILREKEQLRQRRQKLNIEHGTPDEENWFGIALSGGGIRSATINMGFLKTLNRFGILQKADYLSSVSGGGYTHAYIQTTAKTNGGDLGQLFSDEHIEAMRQHGEYLTPGKGFWKTGNTFLLAVAYFISWCMSMISPLIIVGIGYYIYGIVAQMFDANPFSGTAMPASEVARLATYGVAAIFGIHFVTNIYLNFSLGVSKWFNKIETVLAALVLLVYVWLIIADLGSLGYTDGIPTALLKIVTLFVLGFYINPNAISFHRFYRKQLADMYLRFAKGYQNIPLKDVFNAESADSKKFVAPYPLINTCLNLQNPAGDDKFMGAKASDYFLLSPLFCGSKLTGYVPTTFYDDYRNMTLPAAVTISAAAVNPGLGMYSSKLLSILITLANARLGFWVSNPLVLKKAYSLVWWPIYFFRELLGRIGTDNTMVNISDGGHIENLGVYELLRRGCRLIVAVDAGEDKAYTFADLNNLLIRARNEMGLEIRFRHNQQPEELIRPRPTQVYSKQRYAIADIYQWWEDQKIAEPGKKEKPGEIENFDEPRKVGTFIYVKSSVTAPTGKPVLDKKDALKYGTYKYKIYHPDFPHEATSDQFFDPIQWESYYQLGQYLGADVLGLGDLEKYETGNAPQPSVEDLINWFDDPEQCPLFDAGKAAAGVLEQAGYESVRERGLEAVEPEVKYRM